MQVVLLLRRLAAPMIGVCPRQYRTKGAKTKLVPIKINERSWQGDGMKSGSVDLTTLQLTLTTATTECVHLDQSSHLCHLVIHTILHSQYLDSFANKIWCSLLFKHITHLLEYLVNDFGDNINHKGVNSLVS